MLSLVKLTKSLNFTGKQNLKKNMSALSGLWAKTKAFYTEFLPLARAARPAVPFPVVSATLAC